MNAHYKKLLKKLHEKYPEKHISITSAYNYYAQSGGYYKMRYFVHIEDVESKHVNTFADVEEYVQNLCEKEA